MTLYQLMGLRSEQPAEKFQEVEAYTAALELYNAGAFDQAASAFEDVKAEHPCALLYEIYHERCLRMAKNPPEHWDGITDIRMKKAD